MSWNYRIFQHTHKIKSKGWSKYWYGLHEVYYNDAGQPETYAIKPEAVGDNIEDLIASIVLMLKDAKDCQKKIKPKKKTKFLLTPEDFEKGGIYFCNLQALEKETEEAIESATKPTNAKGNSKDPRRKPRTRNK